MYVSETNDRESVLRTMQEKETNGRLFNEPFHPEIAKALVNVTT